MARTPTARGRGGDRPGVELVGAREFVKDLRELGREWPREVTRIYREAAKLVADRARSTAPADVKKSIRPRATQRGAFVNTVADPPRALGVFWGMRRRSGWFRRGRYAASSGRQFGPWVGNQWDPGETGGQPYHIGPAINRSVDDVVRIVREGFEAVSARAFPD